MLAGSIVVSILDTNPTHRIGWLVVIGLSCVLVLIFTFESRFDHLISDGYRTIVRLLRRTHFGYDSLRRLGEWKGQTENRTQKIRQDLGLYLAGQLSESAAHSFTERLSARKFELSIVLGLVVILSIYSVPQQPLVTIGEVVWLFLTCGMSNISIFEFLLIVRIEYNPLRRIPWGKLIGGSWILVLVVLLITILVNLMRLPLIIAATAALLVTTVLFFEPFYLWARFLQKIPRGFRRRSAQSLVFYLPIGVMWTIVLTLAALLLFPYVSVPRWSLVPFYTTGPGTLLSRLTDLFYPILVIESVLLYYLLVDMPFSIATRHETRLLVQRLREKKQELVERYEGDLKNDSRLINRIQTLQIDTEIRNLSEESTHPFTTLNFIFIQILLAIVAALLLPFIQSLIP
jgi:hypothetical protein